MLNETLRPLQGLPLLPSLFPKRGTGPSGYPPGTMSYSSRVERKLEFLVSVHINHGLDHEVKLEELPQ